MLFQPKTPFLTTDGIVEVYDASENFQGIVLIQRKYEPLDSLVFDHKKIEEGYLATLQP